MALMELIARLGINTTNFEMGLKRARSVAEGHGDAIAHSFTKAGLAMLGIHGVTRTVTHIANELIRWSQNIEEARLEFERLGVSVDTNTLQSIKKVGIELETWKVRLAKESIPFIQLPLATLSGLRQLFTLSSLFRDNPMTAWAEFKKGEIRLEEAALGMHSKEEQEKQKQDLDAIRVLHKQIAEQEYKNRLAGLEGEAKLLELTKQRLGFLQLIMNGRLNERQTLESTLSALRLTGEIDSFTRDQFKAHPVQLREHSLDALNKIGGFAQGGQTSETKAVDRISLNTELTAKNTMTMAQALETIKNKTGPEERPNWPYE